MKNETANQKEMQMSSKIETRSIQPKAHIHRGERYEPKNTEGDYNADILPGHSIRIFGTYTNHVDGPQRFDKVFKLGDSAEYDSYNLSYVGKIVKIGPKTVTIKHYEHCLDVTMLDLFSFIRRNWDFDAVKIAARNADEMHYL